MNLPAQAPQTIFSTDTQMQHIPDHPLDQAVALTRNADGSLTGHTHPAYANMVGPFGGITAATLLNAALGHPSRLGDPVALTVNYAGPIAEGPFRIDAQPVRTNRSTQHWSITLSQGEEVATTASAVFAIRRETWSSTETGFPEVPPAQALERGQRQGAPAWTNNYDMRFVRGVIFDTSRPAEDLDSHSELWIRDEPPRPLDFVSLAAICDSFFPRIMVRRPYPVPAGTVSITTYFHADAPLLAAQGERPVLGCARATHFGRGYHDQSAEIWSAEGALLATSHQVVYFKE
jgi:acyl-coenzyme A thioesterase PaaI-like protein